MGSDSAFGEPFYTISDHDFPEDFSHENGNYTCTCVVCGVQFIGLKRRVVCKVCDGNKSEFPTCTTCGALFVDARKGWARSVHKQPPTCPVCGGVKKEDE